VTASYCDTANQAAVKAVAGMASSEAQECLAAKQKRVEADNADAIALAGKKIPLVCDD
jgi:hypothetical protein